MKVYSFNEYINKLAGHTAALLTIDSAPLHIAARLKGPLLAVWGSFAALALVSAMVNLLR